MQADNIAKFFLLNLNRIFCAKSHLCERLPEMREHAFFTDLAHAITETLVDVENQLARMDRIFKLMDAKPGKENCEGMLGLIEDAFTAIFREANSAPEMRDLSILFYLQNIESIELTSFKMLRLAAPKLGNKEIAKLLLESSDEAHDDLGLLQQISANYFK